MEWSVPSGSMKAFQADCDENLLGFLSPGHSSFSQDLYKGGNKKRSHQYIVKDEIEEDELSDELSNPTEKKRRLTVEQVKFLETSFNMDLKLEPERKALLAKRLGIRPRQVAIWFQNRRARWKNKQLEQDYETLKAKYDAVMKEKESILLEQEVATEENKRLQAEVVHLMNLLESVGSRDGLTGVGSEGKSELTSPTKSSEDQSEVQDSGQSYPILGVAAGMEMIVPSFVELDSGLACSVNVKMDSESAPSFLTDDIFGPNLPLLVHQLTTNGIYYEDGFYFNYEDQFSGLTYHGHVEP
ncbi:hypothetical protein GOP47_0020280 [Adiantum capillus-veneris]|uniref:Homeobox domain-containing protein n=1 Tax=Adiantum capillus-veneris TaxID=13818 RepID=A0A9D4UC19_ADICA|nr:hypothetical protein GOP47_0019722 [Adiantum capillus-veneris]KAI5065585.1 hypothetical protein GOP47_0020280 [Adiantum capillus-veneris]